jgi:hypothetical protein
VRRQDGKELKKRMKKRYVIEAWSPIPGSVSLAKGVS